MARKGRKLLHSQLLGPGQSDLTWRDQFFVDETDLATEGPLHRTVKCTKRFHTILVS